MCFRPANVAAMKPTCPSCSKEIEIVEGMTECPLCGHVFTAIEINNFKASAMSSMGAPGAPKAPGAPGAPRAPKAPGAPRAPKAPSAPSAPKVPQN